MWKALFWICQYLSENLEVFRASWKFLESIAVLRLAALVQTTSNKNLYTNTKKLLTRKSIMVKKSVPWADSTQNESRSTSVLHPQQLSPSANEKKFCTMLTKCRDDFNSHEDGGSIERRSLQEVRTWRPLRLQTQHGSVARVRVKNVVSRKAAHRFL